MEEQVRWLLPNHLCILWFGKLLKLEWCWRQICYKVTRLFPSLFSIRETNLCYASSVDTKLLYFPAPTVMRPWKPSTNWQGTVREKYVIIFTPPPSETGEWSRGGIGGGGFGFQNVKSHSLALDNNSHSLIFYLFIIYLFLHSFIYCYIVIYYYIVSWSAWFSHTPRYSNQLLDSLRQRTVWELKLSRHFQIFLYFRIFYHIIYLYSVYCLILFLSTGREMIWWIHWLARRQSLLKFVSVSLKHTTK